MRAVRGGVHVDERDSLYSRLEKRGSIDTRKACANDRPIAVPTLFTRIREILCADKAEALRVQGRCARTRASCGRGHVGRAVFWEAVSETVPTLLEELASCVGFCAATAT